MIINAFHPLPLAKKSPNLYHTYFGPGQIQRFKPRPKIRTTSLPKWRPKKATKCHKKCHHFSFALKLPNFHQT